MKTLLKWLVLWTDKDCGRCQKAIKAIKAQEDGKIKLVITIDRTHPCPMVHAEVE